MLGGMRVPLLLRFGGPLKKQRAATGVQPAVKKKPLPLARRGAHAASSVKKMPLPLARRGKTQPLPLARRGTREAVESRICRDWGRPDRCSTKPGTKSAVCPGAFSGQVSDAQHLAEHGGSKSFCIRCDVQRRRKTYEALSLLPNGSSWLAVGVRRGLWGLGCQVCAKYVASGRKRVKGRFSKVATFQVRPKTGFHARWQV